MKVESGTNASRDIGPANWTPEARRQGERLETPPTQPESMPEDEIVFASISPPPVWPRIFPGI